MFDPCEEVAFLYGVANKQTINILFFLLNNIIVKFFAKGTK